MIEINNSVISFSLMNSLRYDSCSVQLALELRSLLVNLPTCITIIRAHLRHFNKILNNICVQII